MAKSILLILFIFSLLIIPTILASTTDINVKTKSYHRLLITIYKAGVDPPERITSFAPYKDTQYEGTISVKLTTEEKNVDIKLDLKKDDTSVINYEFSDVATGEPVFITLLPPDNMTVTSGIQQQVNQTNTTAENLTALNDTNITQPSLNQTPELNETSGNKSVSASNFSITGYVSNIYQKNSKTIYYILIGIGIIIAIIIIVFILKFVLKRMKRDHYMPAPIKVRDHHHDDFKDASLSDAERKLRAAQEEIERIKQKNNAIREAERKLEEDRIRLERLRKGY